jgi:purine-binding chemotaxis protein CheW
MTENTVLQANPGTSSLPKQTQAATPFIFFDLGGTTYAVPSNVVQQIEMVEHITPVPNAPPFVDGVVFARGQVVTVVNLRSRFGFERSPIDMQTRLMVMALAGRSLGLLVDSAREFITVDQAAITSPPEAIAGLSGQYLAGIANIDGRLVLVLDVEEVVNFQNMPAPQQDN